MCRRCLDSGASLQSVSEALCHKSIETTRAYCTSDHQSLSLAQRAKADHIGNLKEPGNGYEDFDLEGFDFDTIEDGFFEGSSSSSSSCCSKPPVPVEALPSVHPTIPVSVAPPPAMAPAPSVPVFNFYFGNH